MPKAHFYSSKGVGIEERLPIGDTLSFFKNIHFYYKHRDELTQAIADFTRFHFFLQTEDILEKHTEDTHGIRSLLKQKDPYSIRRSDNLPIYRDKDGSYKFGLIDLEFVNDHGPQPTLDKVIRSAEEVTTLFPYHTHTVAKVLSIYCKERSFTETDYFQGIARLINARSLSIKLYYGVIEGHLKFLENHRINPQNAHQFAPFYSTDRRSICDNLLSSDLFHHLYPEKGDAATIERWLSGMIDHLISMTPKSVDSLADLAEARCGHYHFEKALSALIKKECCVLFKGLRGRSLSLFCKRLNQALLAELRLRGLIYHYAPIQNSSIFCVLW